jgi:hypothetical protein
MCYEPARNHGRMADSTIVSVIYETAEGPQESE